MNNLKVSFIDTDCGNTITGNTFAKFGVTENGELLSTVNYSYEDRKVIVTIETLTDKHISGMHSELHLLSCVGKTIMTAFNEDMTFYHEVFCAR